MSKFYIIDEFPGVSDPWVVVPKEAEPQVHKYLSGAAAAKDMTLKARDGKTWAVYPVRTENADLGEVVNHLGRLRLTLGNAGGKPKFH